MGVRLVDLMTRIHSGDEEAFRLLYECLGDEVFAISFTILHDQYAAQDVRQDTFMKILERAGGFRGTKGSDATVRSWVLTIARNKSIDHYRKTQREIPASEFIEERRVNILLDTDSLCERLDLEALLEAIPRKYREAVLLRVFAHLKVSECAEALQVSIPTTKRMIRKGLAALKIKLQLSQDAQTVRNLTDEGGECLDPDPG